MDILAIPIGNGERIRGKRANDIIIDYEDKMTFTEFCNQVDTYFRVHCDWPRSYTQDTGTDCWLEWYKEGMSPEDAAITEIEHWEE